MAISKIDNPILTTAVEQLPRSVLVLESNGKLEFINGSAQRLIFGDNEPSSSDIESYLRDIGLVGSVTQALRGTEVSSGIYNFRSRHSQLNIKAIWNLIYDDRCDCIGAAISLEDITAIINEDIIKTEFLSTISHELRTPIAILKNCVSNMLVGVAGSLNRKSHSYLTTMDYECNRISFLINNMVDMAKIDAGHMAISPSLTDVCALVCDITASFDDAAQSKDITLITELLEPVSMVNLDKERISQVIWNLVDNAVKFTHCGGYVVVRVKTTESLIRFEVEDNGSGISDQHKRDVFKKFSQICRQKGANYNGSGLGLAICKGIVNAHRGEIWVESELGRGSKFIFTLSIDR